MRESEHRIHLEREKNDYIDQWAIEATCIACIAKLKTKKGAEFWKCSLVTWPSRRDVKFEISVKISLWNFVIIDPDKSNPIIDSLDDHLIKPNSVCVLDTQLDCSSWTTSKFDLLNRETRCATFNPFSNQFGTAASFEWCRSLHTYNESACLASNLFEVRTVLCSNEYVD